MLQADNLQTQLGKPFCELGTVHFCTYKLLILRNQQCTDSLSTFSCTGGRSLMPVLFCQSYPSLFFSPQGLYSEMFFHVNTQWPKDAFFHFSLKYQPHIQRLNYACTSLLLNILYPVPYFFKLLLHAALLKEEEGLIEKTWKFRRQASYRKQEMSSCSIKRKKLNKTKTKCRNSQLRLQFGYSPELLLDIQAC